MDKHELHNSRGGQNGRRPRRLHADQQHDSDPRERPFTPDVLDKTVIAVPLLDILEKEERQARKKKAKTTKPQRHPIIIDLNLEFPGGRQRARAEVLEKLIPQAITNVHAQPGERIDRLKSRWSQQYLFGEMEATVIRELVRLDTQDEVDVVSDLTQRVGGRRAIYRIWPDFEFEALTTRSLSTVKADAARNAFGALGEGIVWAVMDSGIDGTHPHFRKHKNLELTDIGRDGGETSLQHWDFTQIESDTGTALQDRYGHGTHVAGIIAGEMSLEDEDIADITAEIGYRNEFGKPVTKPSPIKTISGMAPKCKLLSLKVLDDKGTDPGRETPKGRSSNIIAAIEYIQEINGYGRRLFVHGVNMSVGYEFEPKWFACGQSPLCVESTGSCAPVSWWSLLPAILAMASRRSAPPGASVRREFIGQAERVKETFLSTATDLRRDRYFQGHGLVDLMRAIQSV
jgi:serine protease AprX